MCFGHESWIILGCTSPVQFVLSESLAQSKCGLLQTILSPRLTGSMKHSQQSSTAVMSQVCSSDLSTIGVVPPSMDTYICFGFPNMRYIPVRAKLHLKCLYETLKRGQKYTSLGMKSSGPLVINLQLIHSLPSAPHSAAECKSSMPWTCIRYASQVVLVP